MSRCSFPSDQIMKPVSIRRVSIQLSDHTEIHIYPESNSVDMVAYWPNGSIREVEHSNIEQLIATLKSLATQAEKIP